MTPDLTILTISRHALAFPRSKALAAYVGATLQWYPSETYLESALDTALATVQTPWVFRLDDDEWPSPMLLQWLWERQYQQMNHWKFPRLHLWGDGQHAIVNGPLWPDPQTRLSHVELAGGRDVIHAGSPFGGGQLCPYPILHEKFLKPYAERKAIAESYDVVMEGAGLGNFKPFHLPEDVWAPSDRMILPIGTDWRSQ